MPASMTPNDADFVRELVYRRSAIVLDDSKAYLIESRLSQLAHETGVGTVGDVVQQARSGVAAAAAQTRIIEAITTHETSFFRDVLPFEALKSAILPALKQAITVRPITIWSAACSTGQEPYSIAMLILDAFPELASRVRIIASDLSSQVLEKAKQGSFRQLEVNRGLPAAFGIKYFNRDGAAWHVKDEVKRMVSFRQLNLLDDWAGMPVPDVVFMRYVLIYFDVATKQKILVRVGKTLARGGALLLGGTETTINIDEGWERVQAGRASYYKVR
jgi:chemotaxis protein methyltransferase CheR